MSFPPSELQIIVSNIGITTDFSAIYTPNSHTAFVQVSLKEDHKVGSYEYMRRVREQLSENSRSSPIDIQVSGNNLGLGSIVEFTQAELQKTEADIADATYQYRLTKMVLAFTIAAPK